MPKKRLVAVFTALAMTCGTVGSASAAVWAQGSDGVADVCFIPATTDGITGDAATQAAVAAANWNVTSGLKVTYGTCDTGAQKVPISFGTLPTTGELGLTQWKETSTGDFTSANISFDKTGITQWISLLTQAGLDDNASADAWLTVTCHEEGHALGLDHTTATDSCMQTDVSTPNTSPGAGDIAQLKTWYGGDLVAPTSSTTAKATATTVMATTTTSTTIDDSAATDPSTDDSSSATDPTNDSTDATVPSNDSTDATIPTDDSTDVTTTSTTVAAMPTTTTTVKATGTSTSTTVKAGHTKTDSKSGNKTRPKASMPTVMKDMGSSTNASKWRNTLCHHKVKIHNGHKSGTKSTSSTTAMTTASTVTAALTHKSKKVSN